MFRMIRRAPWIALGATAAYYLDSENGPSRRDRAAGRVRELSERASGRVKDQWRSAGSAVGSRPSAEDVPAPPLTASVPEERVMSRADQPLAEEAAAGVPAPAPPAMAEQILGESERRVVDRTGTAREHRTSEDTVEPVDPTTSVPSGSAAKR